MIDVDTDLDQVPGPDLGLLTSAQLAASISSNHRELLSRENRQLELACAWADIHDLDSKSEDYQPLIQRACLFGGPGTPAVAEHCTVEFGALQALSEFAARLLIGDALDLRHRLPTLWGRVQTGGVRAWEARKVAQATRMLSYEACRDVDRAVADTLGMISWKRFERILTATILDTDPTLAQERTRRARVERDVWATTGPDGLKILVAKATAGDVVWFMATLNRIADLLARDGDGDSVGARRSKALGILAQPAHALQFLLAHQHDPDLPDEPTAQAEPDDTDDHEPEPPEPPRRPSRGSVLWDDQEPVEPGFDDAPADPLDNRERVSDDPGPVGEPATQPSSFDGPVSYDEREDGSVRHPLRLPPIQLTGRQVEALKPKVVLYFHLSDAALTEAGGQVRPEHGDMITVDQLRDFLADTHCQVIVKPVIDPAAVAPVDGYEIPDRIREAARLRQLADVFPYGTGMSRTMDLDHTIPFQPPDEGGPPGQTGVDNVGPKGRRTHRTKTHSCYGHRQPDPGTYVTRTPNGYLFLVTNHGTLNLGRTAFSHAIWQAACADDTDDPSREGAAAHVP